MAIYNALKNYLITQSFAKELNLYAIIDSASVKEMPSLMFDLEEDPEYLSLFHDTPQEELFDVAPYLVTLEQHSPIFEWILSKGWGKSWGIFVVSALQAEDLLLHLQDLLHAEAPDGEKLFFRFYDPRALRVFIPVCNDHELRDLLGPLSDICIETEEESRFMHLFRKDQSIRFEIVSV